MNLSLVRRLWLVAITGFAPDSLDSRAVAGPQAGIEAGLEVAVD